MASRALIGRGLLVSIVAAVAGATSIAQGPTSQNTTIQGRQRTFGSAPAARIAATQSKQGSASTTIADPDDFYYYQGQPVHLRRSVTQAIVRFSTERPETSGASALSLPSPTTIGNAIRTESRIFHIVTTAA